MFSAQPAKFILITFRVMMFHLIRNVRLHCRHVPWAHGKQPVSGLPMKIAVFAPLGFQPFGRFLLQQANNDGWCMRPGKIKQRMNMILDAVDDDDWLVQVLE
jgi:hypothetical protein